AVHAALEALERSLLHEPGVVALGQQDLAHAAAPEASEHAPVSEAASGQVRLVGWLGQRRERFGRERGHTLLEYAVGTGRGAQQFAQLRRERGVVAGEAIDLRVALRGGEVEQLVECVGKTP